MKCPTCGAENEAANRFCEQCGSRIEPSGEYPQAQVALAAQPTAAGPTCPSCGAAVLPGEAFCDECGASLSAAATRLLDLGELDLAQKAQAQAEQLEQGKGMSAESQKELRYATRRLTQKLEEPSNE